MWTFGENSQIYFVVCGNQSGFKFSLSLINRAELTFGNGTVE